MILLRSEKTGSYHLLFFLAPLPLFYGDFRPGHGSHSGPVPSILPRLALIPVRSVFTKCPPAVSIIVNSRYHGKVRHIAGPQFHLHTLAGFALPFPEKSALIYFFKAVSAALSSHCLCHLDMIRKKTGITTLFHPSYHLKLPSVLFHPKDSNYRIF